MSTTAFHRLQSQKNLTGIWKEYWSKGKKSAPGIDGITPKQFNDNLPLSLQCLIEDLRKGYSYSALRGIPVPKKDPTKNRLICIPTVRDRVVQRAVLRLIESRATQLGIVNDVSFGFVKDRPDNKRGTPAARAAAIKARQLKPWAFKTDITAFFDRIPREELLHEFQARFRLKTLLPLVRGAVACEVDSTDPAVRRVFEENGIRSGRGLRQGMPLSPILSNFLLRDFDRRFAEQDYSLIRYADDLVVFAHSYEECATIQELTIAELGKLGLDVSPGKTVICPPDEAVEFLGMELGLKKGTNSYTLSISDKQQQKLRESFVQYHDVEFTVGKGLNIGSLLLRLERMKAGYQIAYGIADNFPILEQQLDQWEQNCILKVYGSIFGQAAISKLKPRQKQFLMIA